MYNREAPFVKKHFNGGTSFLLGCERVFGYVNSHFPIARLYTAFIPIYPAGMHCFTLGSKTFDPLTWTPNREQNFETKYYNADIQKAAFALPNFVKNYLPTK